MAAENDRVIAETRHGDWLRGTVLEARADGPVRVRFGDDESAKWLPRTLGIGYETEWCGPERIARLMEAAPTAPPPVAATVIALWDRSGAACSPTRRTSASSSVRGSILRSPWI